MKKKSEKIYMQRKKTRSLSRTGLLIIIDNIPQKITRVFHPKNQQEAEEIDILTIKIQTNQMNTYRISNL